ncbi:hypothetical protein NQ318_006438 [Aromia moschata]|uniref:Uncharacterized protein n=1 Tax=Aromia moschata TaxID=1265417 RepID=A0AAV8XPK8_9CUCU|nr:hypothetical protein NQ318_006438 [Aromia moschata]
MVSPSRARPRLSIVDWANYNAFEPQGKGTYAFGYDVEDPETNNIQYRDEERHSNGTVTGSYGYLRPDGNVQIVHYVADDKGYRVKIETNPRGQLKKPLDNDNLFPQESYMSPALASALRSKQVYKKQRVHERRTRPIDMSHASIRNSLANFTSPLGLILKFF